ncbi:MAG: family 78 glycoside hydrolase catalytic domain [Acidobacteria bacterium]|nr:family 78 glycoside hydrolase catalytic domain [Acidobacteriota bacterium]
MRLVLLLCFTSSLFAQSVTVTDLRTEYLRNPDGIAGIAPRLSWRLESAARNVRQTAYQILVSSSAQNLASGKADLWDSGKQTSRQSAQIAFGGTRLNSRQQCFWKVRVWDQENKPSNWSEPARWSMGLLSIRDWQAAWISHQDTAPLHTSREKLYLPAPRYYRKPFRAAQPVKRAMLYASALGIYDAYLNGKRVSERMFSPGWSDYGQRAYYQSLDVTPLVGSGDNVLSVILAEGWYSGYVGYGLLVGYGPNKAGRYFYGKTPALLAQLEIEYADGKRELLYTDTSWKVSTGGTLEADMLMGETHDARLEPEGWQRAGFDDAKWAQAIRAEDNGSARATFTDRGGERLVELGFQHPQVLQPYLAPPVMPVEEIKPVKVMPTAGGGYLFDFGQNFSGVVRLKATAPAGTRVQIEFGEMLHKDGRLSRENLRKARAIDAYVFGGKGEESWTPRFTYHGFRYAELKGFPSTPDLNTLTGIVVHSATPLTSTFKASDPMLEKLHSNIVWTQRSNFVELPTDCPQRDERLGWTGDAQTYARTASYHADVAAFFTKWMSDLAEAQRPNGAFPDYAPYPMQHGGGNASYGTAWMDAGIIVPHTMWKVYGDRRMIEQYWQAMTRFMEFRLAASPEFRGVKHGNPWGDWLAIGSETPLELIDAAYFAYDAKLMEEMAAASNQEFESQRYRTLFRNIRDRFARDYVLPGGKMKVETQTAYALALHFDLIPANLRMQAGQHLADLVKASGYKMTTGFLGTKPLIPALTATGHNDLALRLVQSRQFPSWGYEVENGATTIWERWNSYTKEGGIHEPSMNSFSHYAFGAVSEWIFSRLAGIDTEGPAYERIRIRPNPPSKAYEGEHKLESIAATYDSIRGRIGSAWRKTADGWELTIIVPPNGTAWVELPAASREQVKEDGGARFLKMEAGRPVYEAGSGTYRFAWRE